MGKRSLQVTQVDQIFRETAAALECARQSVSAIAEKARAERDRLQEAARALTLELADAKARRERSEKAAAAADARLAAALGDLPRSPDAVREAFETSKRAHVEFAAALEQERALKERLADVERSLVSAGAMAAESKAMLEKLSAALGALTGDLGRMAGQWEEIKVRYQIGERVIKAQEEERRRVAREIHDGPAQALANVALRTEICERLHAAGRPEAAQELAQLKLLVRECLRELRRIIFNLRPMALDDLGLIPTLRRYLENLREQEGCPVTFTVSGKEARLNSLHEVAVFRLVQEAVNNARKHAQASSIEVAIAFVDDQYVEIRVEDDGVGFDIERLKDEWADRESFGLMSMKERIELLDGDFEVTSALGKGTRLWVRVPFGRAHAPAEAV